MAASAQACTFESLNAFVHQRLTTIAGEICQIFQDTLKAFQNEIELSKQENVYLKKLLLEISDGADPQSDQADGFHPEQQNSRQTPVDSETVQVKLELSTMQQELQTSRRSSTCSPVRLSRAEELPHITDPQAGHADKIPDLHQNSTQKPLDSSTTQIQVKLEHCSEQENAEPQEQPNRSCTLTSSLVRTVCRKKRLQSFSVKTVQEKTSDCAGVDSATFSSDNSNTPVQTAESEIRLGLKDEPMSPAPFHQDLSGNEFSHRSSCLQSHASHRTFYCDVCGKSFENESLLAKHMVNHQNRNSNCCILCGKCYSTPHVLKIHLRTHTGERPYHCRFCDKTFSQKGHLKGHERMHTGEKIYSCSICGVCFTWMSQAKEHLRCHSGQMGRVLRKMSK